MDSKVAPAVPQPRGTRGVCDGAKAGDAAQGLLPHQAHVLSESQAWRQFKLMKTAKKFIAILLISINSVFSQCHCAPFASEGVRVSAPRLNCQTKQVTNPFCHSLFLLCSKG